MSDRAEGSDVQVDTFVGVYVGLEREKVPVIVYQDGFYWRCAECGWLGTRCASMEFAIDEAGRHWDSDHPLLERGVMKRVDQR